MEIICRPDGKGLNLGERNTALFRAFVRDNPRVAWKLTPVLPESNKQRRFYHGAVIPLWAFLNGQDHRDGQVLADLHEVAKLEWNATTVIIDGVPRKVGRSTRGRDQLQPFLERVVGYLVDNYAPPPEALDSNAFIVWRDTIYPYGGADDYIDHLKSIGVLTK